MGFFCLSREGSFPVCFGFFFFEFFLIKKKKKEPGPFLSEGASGVPWEGE